MIHWQKLQCLPSTPHLVTNAIFDWEVCGIYAGFWPSECWAQEDHVRSRPQVKLTIKGTPMAFLIDDLQFFGKNCRTMSRTDALRRPYLVQQKWTFAGVTKKKVLETKRKPSSASATAEAPPPSVQSRHVSALSTAGMISNSTPSIPLLFSLKTKPMESCIGLFFLLLLGLMDSHLMDN